ncbi:MAG: capsule biosynthesis protein [Chlorobiaceae bacterium]|nr:capsule biosynthesis protein [Chlorobiaceae bacterium]
MFKGIFLFLAALLLASFPLQGFGAESSYAGFQNLSPGFNQSSFSSTPLITTPRSEPASFRQEDAMYQKNYVEKPAPQTVFYDDGEQSKQAKTAFQNYINNSTGTELELFGRKVFENVPSTYAPLKNVQVNPDYVIGPGDALQIKGWGMVDIDADVTVSRSGTIYLPRVGNITVSGVRYRDLQDYLKKAIGRFYTNFELSVSIAQTRSVQVYVTGHAKRPGSYTLSAMSTMLNAMFLSGGPSVTGTMRNIKIKRGDGTLMTFDLYDILIHGDKSSDLTLRDGDVIYISPVGPLVALLGDVKTPAIYELKQKTSIADLTNWAGGFVTAADLKQIIVEKRVANRFQTVAELEYDWVEIQDKLARLSVQPSDIIRVIAPGAVSLEVLPERSFVVVDGEIGKSGVYEINKDETLRNLIKRIGGVTEKAYVFGTSLKRESLRKSQQVKIEQMADRFEKDLETSSKQRLAAATEAAEIQIIQGELESQRRIAKKLREVKAEGRIILNTLRNAKATIADFPELPLKDGDVVYIPQRPTTVDVIGAVYQQNTFIWEEGKGLNSYVRMAGGVSPTGARGEVYTILANGTVESQRHGGGCNINPGDAIVVPEKLQRGKTFIQYLKDWTAIFYQFGLGAAGLKVLQ